MTEKRDKPRSLSRIADDLSDWVYYIQDDQLKLEVIEFLEEVDSLHSTDLLDHIETELSRLRRHESDEGHVIEHPMRRPHNVGGDDGSEHFPDSCEGCPNEGTCCPVFHDPKELKARERMQNDLRGADHVTTKQEYDRFASANSCHQILTFIDEWGEYEALLSDGWRLYKQVVGVVDVASEDSEEAAAAAVEQAEIEEEA